MFPDETHLKVIRRIDELEAEVYSMYRKIARFRLGLQRQWRVLPSGERWTEQAQAAAESAPEAAQ